MHPILPLAITMHATKGVFALLIGSGISRAAEIPTGWEIVLDLVRKTARLQGEQSDPFPAEWYEAKFGERPDYSTLLGKLAMTAPERSRLLRGYFEPTDEERERGVKQPTAAHRAIAELVKRGYVRVIVTTNFDRLLEYALEEAGVAPTVIATADAVEGAEPLAHLECAIIKVHGDYLDARIRNTADELAAFPDSLNRLLDRVFDEYGLIVCGWSAEWDGALRAALERCESRRYTTYWTVRNPKPPGDLAQRLISFRRAVVLPTSGADDFFQQLAEHVTSLENLARPHPLSAAIARETLKRYVAEDRHRVRLYDLVTTEATRVRDAVANESVLTYHVEPNRDEVTRRLRRYEAMTEVLLPLMATGCFWGTGEQRWIWQEALERVASVPNGSGYKIWLSLRRYPALLTLYAGGVAAVGRGCYDTLKTLLLDARVGEPSNPDLNPALLVVSTARVGEHGEVDRVLGRHLSGHILADTGLREVLREYLPQEERFQAAFDRFEYLLGLVHADILTQRKRNVWGPIGQFVDTAWVDAPRIAGEILTEATASGVDWPPLRAGLFEGDVVRFEAARIAYNAHIDRHRY